jgi:hypothetical protein
MSGDMMDGKHSTHFSNGDDLGIVYGIGLTTLKQW